MSMTSEVFERKRCNFKNKNDSFLYSNEQTFERQYFSIYRCRLDSLRAVLTKIVEKKFKHVPIRKLADLQENEKCVIIGTIYKEQALKPSVLKQIAAETNTLPQPIKMVKFVETNDKLILEDEDLRVLLTGDICVGDFVCGVTLALYGSELDGGSFNVEEVVLPGLPPFSLRSLENAEADDAYVLLVSGLYFCGNMSDDVKQWFLCKSLLEWVAGITGDVEEQRKVSKIVRVIIAGNSISDTLTDKNFGNIAKYLTRKTASPCVEAMKNLDTFLERLANCVYVDLMPGEFDPVNHFLPQQPLHKCVLPKSCRYSTMNNVTNPYMAEINGLTFLGTSGQSVDDIYRFSEIENRLDLAKRTLHWRHLSPTSPDTLDCFPYYTKDPFILNERPNVYFIGNQPELSSDLLTFDSRDPKDKTLIVTLPNFAKTGFCALVNLKDLSVEPIEFVCDIPMSKNELNE